MKRVIFFVTGLDSGGIENYLLRFLQYKASSFSEVIIYCKGGKGGQLEGDYEVLPNVKIVKNCIGFFSPPDYFRLSKYLRQQRFSAVCDFTGNFAGPVLWSAKLAGIKKRVVFYRGSTDRFKETLLKKQYNNLVKHLTYIFASDILSNSQAAFDFFFTKKQQDHRFKVIYNGLDAEKFEMGNRNLRHILDIPHNAFVIGHTGRFNSAKNHYAIIEVAKKLIKKYPDIYFILCGNGVRHGLDIKVKTMGIENNIRLFDNREDIPLFLNTMDAYFFPSLTEGQPNALIEAMVMGLPFVASNIAPIQETVGADHHLYAPNDVTGFADALEEYYLKRVGRDDDLKKNTIRRFDYKERFNEFYHKLLP